MSLVMSRSVMYLSLVLSHLWLSHLHESWIMWCIYDVCESCKSRGINLSWTMSCIWVISCHTYESITYMNHESCEVYLIYMSHENHVVYVSHEPCHVHESCYITQCDVYESSYVTLMNVSLTWVMNHVYDVYESWKLCNVHDSWIMWCIWVMNHVCDVYESCYVTHMNISRDSHMGWLRLVGSLK